MPPVNTTDGAGPRLPGDMSAASETASNAAQTANALKVIMIAIGLIRAIPYVLSIPSAATMGARKIRANPAA